VAFLPPDDLEIDPHEVARRRAEASDDLLLLDCRTTAEHEVARIDGSLLIPMPELPERLGEIEAWRERAIVVYCHAGVRSLDVTRRLRRAGFTNVRSMAGGIHRWSVEIDPTVPVY